MAMTYRAEGDDVIVRIPGDEVQSLRVALQPCPCKGTKSVATAAIREGFVRGLGQALFAKPSAREAR
ncbi:hypothetical protein GQE99_14570 [Maritimibacter sp. DP07]|uniref:Uncharacterized protein n=1 Tax=Maritimibacter harenae TaxID=2606218 RepID=A0A845MAG4_9RHOB|nr:hypothetical protein [Maritimibacter harenae]MZR14244.1 hypothetical protein [Maritimibacter harenae]